MPVPPLLGNDFLTTLELELCWVNRVLEFWKLTVETLDQWWPPCKLFADLLLVVTVDRRSTASTILYTLLYTCYSHSKLNRATGWVSLKHDGTDGTAKADGTEVVEAKWDTNRNLTVVTHVVRLHVWTTSCDVWVSALRLILAANL